MKGIKPLVRAEHFGPAAAKFSSATRLFDAIVRQISILPRPPVDAARIAKWFVYLTRQQSLLMTITAPAAPATPYPCALSAFRAVGKPGRCVYAIMYTLPVAKTVPVRELRSNLSSLLDDVSDRRDHVLVTRNGKPAAALVPIDEYEALEETAEILSDPDALLALEEGLAEIERGETVTLAELRSELAERRLSAG